MLPKHASMFQTFWYNLFECAEVCSGDEGRNSIFCFCKKSVHSVPAKEHGTIARNQRPMAILAFQNASSRRSNVMGTHPCRQQLARHALFTSLISSTGFINCRRILKIWLIMPPSSNLFDRQHPPSKSFVFCVAKLRLNT